MNLKPRDYQYKGVIAIWEYFQNGGQGNPIVAMPTGTGKSIVIAFFIWTIYQKYHNQRILVLTHVKELIEQNYEKLTTLWPTAPAGVYSAGLNKRDLYCNITFAGIASVAKRASEFNHIDLIIIDEAHLVSPNENTMYRAFIDDLKSINPYIKVVGLTATPYRLGHGEIIEEGGLFTDICYDLTTMDAFNELIAEGYIAPLIPKRTKLLLNVDGVHKSGGEYIAKELQNAVDKREITEAACREAMELGHDRKCWLVFTAGVEHAIHTAELLNELGISAVAVHSGNKTYKMSSGQRDRAIEDFKAGRIQALVNNNVLTTGFDHPPIDLIVMIRPTSSPGLWVQMLGRGTRPCYANGHDLTTKEGRLAAIEASEKQNCLVLDFGGNTKRLGPINDPVLPPKRGKKTGDAPIKLCEGVLKDGTSCSTWVHASARWCPECNFEFKFKTKIKQGASTEELIKGDLPIVEEYTVDHITYTEHVKNYRSDVDPTTIKPPSMKVTYFCGFKMFTEYVCFAHTDYAGRRAKQWWAARSDLPVPATAAEGLAFVEHIRASTSLRVWINKKYPEIVAHCIDGSEFGKKEVDLLAQPSRQVDKPVVSTSFMNSLPNNQNEEWEDDIPF